MKFGIAFANAGPRSDPDGAVTLARLAEDAGFDSLWTVEHVVVPAGYESSYPYSRDGRMPGGEDVPIPDPLVWLAYVAASTTTLKLATGVLILPQRNPVVLAKQVATLDVLSRGRVLLGVGVGWLAEEFDAIGVPFAERGTRTDEYIAALRELWSSDEPTFSGRFTSFDRAKSWPKPAQPGGVPIVVGGHTDAAARRAGKLGDGFFPARAALDELGHLLGVMRRSAEEAGRDPDAIEITCGGAIDLDGVRRYEDAGVHRLIVPPLGNAGPALEEALTRFGDEVIAKAG